MKGSARLGNSVRRWPWGFLGLVVMVGLVENGLGRHEIHYSTEWSAAWKRAGEAARKEAVQADLLCFGDSLVMHAVAPRILEARLGRSAYNLAVFKGQAPSSYFLLKAALDAGAKPSAVLIDGELLTDNPLEMVRLWPELATYEDLFELAWKAHRPEFFGSVAVGKLMPSVRMRYEVREFAAARLNGQDYSPRLAMAPRIRNWTENLGANIRPSASVPDETAAKLLEGYLPSEWVCHPVNGRYVKRFLRLAESRGIPVFWLLPPLRPEVQERRDRGGLSSKYEGFVRELVATYPNLQVLDARHSNFPGESMVDMTHTNRLGAAVFSELVAEALKTRLDAGASGGDRWVRLSEYRTPPTDVAIEDLDESLEALRAAYRERVGRK